MGADPNRVVFVLSPCLPHSVSVRSHSHPFTMAMGHHGSVPMGRFAACGSHILEMVKRLCGTRGLHLFLHLLLGLLHYGIGHGGHEAFECIQRDISFSPSRDYPIDWGSSQELSEVSLASGGARAFVTGTLSHIVRACVASLTIIAQSSLPTDGAKSVSGTSHMLLRLSLIHI